MYHILFIQSPVDTWVAATFLAVVNNAAVNMGVQISLLDPAFSYFDYPKVDVGCF